MRRRIVRPLYDAEQKRRVGMATASCDKRMHCEARLKPPSLSLGMNSKDEQMVVQSWAFT